MVQKFISIELLGMTNFSSPLEILHVGTNPDLLPKNSCQQLWLLVAACLSPPDNCRYHLKCCYNLSEKKGSQQHLHFCQRKRKIVVWIGNSKRNCCSLFSLNTKSGKFSLLNQPVTLDHMHNTFDQGRERVAQNLKHPQSQLSWCQFGFRWQGQNYWFSAKIRSGCLGVKAFSHFFMLQPLT